MNTFHPIDSVPRDSNTESIWQSGLTIPETGDPEEFNPDHVYDVLIVGGGITSLTTAVLLQESGRKCILAEAQSIGYGTTGGTTAHINTFLDNSYNYIEKDFGEEGARLVAGATSEAISIIENFVKRFNINCDFEYKKGYLYAQDEKESEELQDILSASKKAGVSVDETTMIPIPSEFKKAIVFDRQAQIHPLKYILGLANAFIKLGGVVLQGCMVGHVEKNENYHIANVNNKSLRAQKVVYATHIPPGINLLHFRCAPYRSYVMGIRLKNDAYPSDLVYDLKDPYHYLRTQRIEDKNYLILGGADHKTGHGNPDDSFRSLEQFARKHYEVESIDFKWSSQYYIPSDGLPYIGKLPGFDEDIYTATGFSGNGITLGSISGKILRDLICENKNPYAELFSPGRLKPVAGFNEFVKENADVAYRFIADRISMVEIDSLQQIAPGEAAIIEYKNQKLAVYKDPSGKIHALNPVCTHAKCIVNWNSSEKSWDCPCHGARYDIHGEVLNGPAQHSLQKVDIS